MIIYIEFLIIDNLVINSLLLYFSAKTLRLKFSKISIFMGAVVGMLGAAFLPLVNAPILPILALKAVLGLLCVLVSIKEAKVRSYFKCFAVFLGYTFLLGGGLIAVFNLLALNMNSLLILNNSFTIPMGVYILGVIGIFMFLKKLIVLLNKHKKSAGYLYSAKLTLNNKTIETNGYLDSGNRLKDVASGKPINIITFTLFEKLYSAEALNSILEKNIDSLNLNGAHFVNFASLGAAKKELFVFAANKLELEAFGKKSIIENALCGVVFKQFNDNVPYDILLNSETECA